MSHARTYRVARNSMQTSKWAGKKPPKKQKRKFQFGEKNKRNSDKARTADDDTDDEGEAFAGRARAVDFREKHNSYENDSSYGDELYSYPASLTSSVLEFRHENGRSYHKYRDGSYLFPNNESENDRLDTIHELFLTLIIAPEALLGADRESTAGIWAIDFADQHPQAEVLLLGVTPGRPEIDAAFLRTLSFWWTTSSLTWTYESNPFDYIHARLLALSIKDFGKLIKQCYRSVKPGGWVEFQDLDAYPYSEDGRYKSTALERYYNEVYGAFEQAGVEVRPGPKLKQWFKDAGFVNIHVEKFVIPNDV
ncbi:hypothetical protein VTN49DRAFT_7837 [Thermomyces lanuginosus]|uniref:uncharacterized protein n=1 Tax=Thermomyces lanuginosus TaxID=5541 RepID=UPI0037422EAA